MTIQRASQVAPVVKNPPGSAKDTRDVGLIPGSGRSPGARNDNPFQYSCLKKNLWTEEPGAGYCPWGRKESDMTERLHFTLFMTTRFFLLVHYHDTMLLCGWNKYTKQLLIHRSCFFLC